jgi:hypothetical protein
MCILHAIGLDRTQGTSNLGVIYNLGRRNRASVPETAKVNHKERCAVGRYNFIEDDTPVIVQARKCPRRQRRHCAICSALADFAGNQSSIRSGAAVASVVPARKESARQLSADTSADLHRP